MASIQALLEDFATQVENREYFEAEVSADRLRREYDDDVIGRIQHARALAARDVGDSQPSDQLTLHEYLQHSAATKLQRSAFMLATASVFTTPRDLDTTRVVQLAKTLEDEEAELANRRTDIKPVVADMLLPAIVTVVSVDHDEGPFPKGTSFTLSTVVGNLGDEEATDVSLDVLPESGIEVSPTVVTGDDIEAGDEVVFDFEIRAENAGEFSLRFQVSSLETPTDEELVELTVADKEGFVAIADRRIANLSRAVRRDFSGGIGQSLVAKLDAADNQLDEASRFAGEGRAHEADRMLDAAIQELQAFISQLKALPDEDGFLIEQAERTVMTLQQGQRAEL